MIADEYMNKSQEGRDIASPFFFEGKHKISI